MQLHFFGKSELGMHDLIRVVMPAAILGGGNPEDFSPVGEVLGQLVSSGCYEMFPLPYTQGNKSFVGWQIRRLPSATAAKIKAAVPQIMVQADHLAGLEVADKVTFQVNEGLFEVAEGLIDFYGKKPYEEDRDGKIVTVMEDVFLKEHISRWEYEAFLKADPGLGIRFAHSLDSRGGRQYPSPVEVRDGNGRIMRSFPTMQTGEASAFMRMATPITVTSKFVTGTWIPAISREFKVPVSDINHLLAGDSGEMVEFLTKGSHALRGVGKAKRNQLAFASQIGFVQEAIREGVSHGYMPSRDAHANGWVTQFLAYGDEILREITEKGRDVYGLFINTMNPVTTGICDVDKYLASRDWMKGASTPAMYTSRFLAPVFVYGPASGVPLGCLPEDFATAHKVVREELNSAIKAELGKMSDGDILSLAEKAGDSALTAMYRAIPRTMGIVDAWLAAAKAIHKDGRILSVNHGGETIHHWGAEPALQWFPADKAGNRDLPQVSITIPEKYRKVFEANKWPVRYQPTCAPFVRGEMGEDGNPILPYKGNGKINTDHTPNGSSVRIISRADGRVLTRVQCELDRDWADAFVASRHDAITVRPTEAYNALPGIYASHMWEEAQGVRASIGELVGNKSFGPMMPKNDFIRGAAHIMK
jgi:hypothetical protein